MTLAAEPFRCSAAAIDRADPLVGSAPQHRGWLMLEHPGPWPVDAVAGSGITPGVLDAVTRACSRAGVRPLLVRRPGRRTRDLGRRWILARLDGSVVDGLWERDEDLVAAVAALDGTAGDAPDPGSPSNALPLLLVCAHGVHDTCCAVRGRPVAAALARHWPDQVWECSHIGGDRFAPNVVVLPDGFYYGRLDPDTAVTVIGAHLAGVVDTVHLRGLAAYAPPVQTAVAAGYQRYAPLPPGAVSVVDVRHVGPHDGHGSETFVRLAVGAEQVDVHVLSVRRPAAHLTCRAARPTPATEFRVLSFGPVTA